MGFLGRFSAKLLLGIAVTLLTTGCSLIEAGKVEMGALLIALGIALILVVAYLESQSQEKLETTIAHLRRELAEKKGPLS